MAFKDNSTIFPYVVVLKKKHSRPVELISLLATFIFILLLVYKLLTGTENWIFLALTIFGFSGLLVYNVNQFRRGKKTDMLISFTALASFFFLPLSASLLFLTLAFTRFLSTKKEEIGFADDHIVFKSVFSKKIRWEDLNNAMIKDGILTLDYKNNKIFQAETDDDEDEEDYIVSEEEFNAWCSHQLKA